MTAPESSTRFTASRAALLNYILLFFGTTLILAAIIFFFAYNWAALPRLAKLGIAQTGFFACAIAAATTKKRPLLSQTLLFAAAIIIGAFLAVFGQTYQTGADPWQLFALWATLIIPLAKIAKNQSTWLAFAIIAALASNLFLNTFLPPTGNLDRSLKLILHILTPTLFFAAIWLKFEHEHRTQNRPQPWSRPLLAFIIFAALTLGITFSYDLTTDITFYALLAATTTAAYFIFANKNLDITVLGIAALAWLLSLGKTLANALLTADIHSTLFLIIMSGYFIATSTALITMLQKLRANQTTKPHHPPLTPQITDHPTPSTSKQPQIISIITGTAGWFASLFFTATLLAFTGYAGDATRFLTAFLLGFAVIALELKTQHHNPKNNTRPNNAFLTQAIIALSLSAQWMAIYSFFKLQAPALQIASTLLFCTAHYALIRSNTLRFLTAATFVTACTIYLIDESTFPTNLTNILTLYALFSSLFFLAIPYLPTISKHLKTTLLPAAYATTLATFILSWTTQSPGYSPVFILITLLALVLSVLENKHNPNARKLLITATALAALTLFTHTSILWAFTLLAIAFWRERNTLIALATLGLTINLTLYYYNLHITLLAKSGILLASGILFITLFWFLELHKNTTTTAHETNP